ncbi:MAG: type II toxin-antitoxin system HicA family toxin [Desulfobacter sp.]|uniref:type II toxin-antitoxin system HicA family toxin n=1 Tax=uncultured Desulfobacter sp. TaxID=240139 RepID=UPI0029C62F6F|nr:type II toxin-antitoxin system HicA family toxin [uncultured Desulfobacter sp.]MCW8800701.1 type II toxin-antitoxin system HicA family toxin [Desulfobacter sp.]
MPELPRISGDLAIKIFIKLGFCIARQKGSHVVLRKGDKGCVIPKHKALAVGTLKSAIRQAGIQADDFVDAYKGK